MINYYVLLNKLTDRNDLKQMDEEKLRSTLKKMSKKLRQEGKKLKGKEAAYTSVVELFLRRFLTTLDHYGSKENYDRALSKSAKIVNVKAPNKKKIGKFVLVTAAVGAMAFGLYNVNFKDVHVPIFPQETYQGVEEELNALGIDADFIAECRNNLDTGIYRVKRKDSDKLEKYNNEREDTYSFLYIVKEGETYDDLAQRFKPISVIKDNGTMGLKAGDVVKVTTHFKEIADQGRRLYAEEKDKKPDLEPTSFEGYTVKAGDTVGSIALKFGITYNALAKYNPSIEDLYSTIYEGQNLNIPVYEVENVKTR